MDDGRAVQVRPLGAVAGAFAAQGIGYALVVTALPAVKDRLELTDAVVSGLLLGVCIAAVLGSGVADAVAVRRGSRTALVAGLSAQAAALVGLSLATTRPAFGVAVAVYGVGLGMVDASTNMQGVALQAAAGRALMGRLYAAFTVGGITGALLAAASGALGGSAIALLAVAAAVQAGVALLARSWLPLAPAVRSAPAPAPGLAARPRLPRGPIGAVGAMVLVAFVVDAAVSSWSTVYLADGLDASAGLAPVGYAVYQGVVLLARLTGDAACQRFGRRAVGAAGAAAGVLGCALVAVGTTVPLAFVGLAVAGGVAGLLLPIAFSQAGDVVPERSDEVIARVNVFNYAGAVLGAVVPGLLGGGEALRFGFVVPAVALLLVAPIVVRLPGRVAGVDHDTRC